ncbi:MAG: DUF4974 domain-containing protein [Cyclobacteriaceae bacterium]|nr:DUF4974 domain-containing protein [Cyclobacteriaceae bacterium]
MHPEINIGKLLMDESFLDWAKNPGSENGKFWEAWLAQNPQKREEANLARKMILSITFQDKSFDKSEITRMWESIKSESHGFGGSQSLSGKRTRFINLPRLLKVAAILIPFMIAAALFVFVKSKPRVETVQVQQNIEKHNPKGQKLTVFLSDGSKVKLNADSKISYSKPFGKTNRQVYLEGEAFFEIAPDASRPFVVTTGQIDTRVVGTSFNIKAYPAENNITVAVKTGTVSVTDNSDAKANHPSHEAIRLSPSEMLTYSNTSSFTKVTSYNENEVLGWSEGVLYFNNATMEEFVAELERWYGVDIVVERTVPIKKGIVGQFKDQTLEEILMGTRDASEFEYEFKDDKVIIR